MKNFSILSAILIVFSMTACTQDGTLSDEGLTTDSFAETSGEYPEGGQGSEGIVTAGEWNDLYNWDFWNNLLNESTFSDKQNYWSFYTNNRISVQVKINSQPAVNSKVVIKKQQEVIWESRTDNFGMAELWIGLFDNDKNIQLSDYKLYINNEEIATPLKLYNQGIVSVAINTPQTTLNTVEISFIVDATGSMSDEITFLKDDLRSVIQQVKTANSALNISTSAVFYRDEGDEYVVKKSDFTSDISRTMAFINNQEANGGGDFPEAVHTALQEAINNLQWSDNAKSRIAFLLLDAPPHYESQIISTLQNLIKTASKKGIKVIPVTASGIDKETEFLMRFFSIATNGTYVFITNHSGVGNDHLTASVGAYEVEKLNELLVRLINKYAN